MDRSYLSQAEVIAASQKFVCVRLATYEDKGEIDLLRSLFVGRSGDVENTTFAILSPDGTQPLIRSGRTARQAFGSAREMAETMTRLAQQYPAGPAVGDPELPKVANVRLALDIAACDNQPLAVLFARDPAALRQLENRARKLAWSDDFRGRLVYAATTSSDHLKAIDGVPPAGGLLVVQSDRFGVKGQVLAQAAAGASPAELAKVLKTGLAQHRTVDKSDDRDHVRTGHWAGIFYEPPLPITDPMERMAREKGRKPPPP